jgi:uncharacterized protein
MSQTYSAAHLDVPRFTREGAELSGSDALSKHERLILEALEPQAPATLNTPVTWRALGELVEDASGHQQHWLHLQAHTAIPMTCQRCLTPVQVPLDVDQSFRFVASEDEAMEQDDEAEEDLLVLSREFNLSELLEDELLMAVPLVPRHEVCPGDLKMTAADDDFEQDDEKANPFAVLANLKNKPN